MVRMLRDAVENLRDGVQRTLRNGERSESGLRAGRRITSFPVDPAATHFARRVNRFTPADLPSR